MVTETNTYYLRHPDHCILSWKWCWPGVLGKAGWSTLMLHDPNETHKCAAIRLLKQDLYKGEEYLW